MKINKWYENDSLCLFIVCFAFDSPYPSQRCIKTTDRNQPTTLAESVSTFFICVDVRWLLTLLLSSSQTACVIIVPLWLCVNLFFPRASALRYSTKQSKKMLVPDSGCSGNQMRSNCECDFSNSLFQKILLASSSNGPKCHLQLQSIFYFFMISLGVPYRLWWFGPIKDYSFNHIVKITCFTILSSHTYAHTRMHTFTEPDPKRRIFLDFNVPTGDKIDDTFTLQQQQHE